MLWDCKAIIKMKNFQKKINFKNKKKLNNNYNNKQNKSKKNQKNQQLEKK